MKNPSEEELKRAMATPPGRQRPGTAPDATVLTVTEAARSFSDVVNRVYYRGERFVLTKGGRAVAAVAPVHDAPPVTASALRRALESLLHLGIEEAEAFAADLEEARRFVGPPEDRAWES